jgi:hypothetical protein
VLDSPPFWKVYRLARRRPHRGGYAAWSGPCRVSAAGSATPFLAGDRDLHPAPARSLGPVDPCLTLDRPTLDRLTLDRLTLDPLSLGTDVAVTGIAGQALRVARCTLDDSAG